MPSGTAAFRSSAKVGERWSSGDVEAELVEQRLALLLAAGDADGARALDLGDLADGRADRSGGGSDHDGLARLAAGRSRAGPAYAVNPGMPSTPSAVEIGAADGSSRRTARRRRSRASASRSRTAPRRPGRYVRARDSTTSQTVPPTHHVADLDRGGVRRRGAHPAAHVGVERQVDGAQQHLAVLEVGQVDHLGGEAAVVGLPDGAGGEADLRRLHASASTRGAVGPNRSPANDSGTSTSWSVRTSP